MTQKKVDETINKIRQTLASPDDPIAIFLTGSRALGYADDLADWDFVIITKKQRKMRHTLIELDGMPIHLTFYSWPILIRKIEKRILDDELLQVARWLLHGKALYDPEKVAKGLRKKIRCLPITKPIHEMLQGALFQLTDALTSLKKKRYDTVTLNLRFAALSCAALLVFAERGYYSQKWLLYELDKVEEKYEKEIQLIRDILDVNKCPEEVLESVLKTNELWLRLKDRFKVID
jgi:predicted nucleotidyltransferase